jgi:hypothetical protein
MIDAYNDPYAQRMYAHIKRSEFEKFKRTNEFKSWKNIQTRAQKHRCAYCKVKFNNGSIIIHTDHVTPLFHEGKNNIENLVLACKKCNLRKYTANHYVYPAWIIENKRLYRLKRIRTEQKKQMKALVTKEFDEQLLATELSWLLLK